MEKIPTVSPEEAGIVPDPILQNGSYRATDSNPFVSERLYVFENAPTIPSRKRSSLSNDVDGYSGMSESTVSERALAFKFAAKKVVALNRQSLIPSLRMEEKGKRILREEWIRNNSPTSSPDKAMARSPLKEKKIPSSGYIDQRLKEASPRPKRSSMSSARTELPRMLAHVKVSERASNYTAYEEEHSQRRRSSRFLARSESSSLILSEARTEMPTMLAHVKVSERASNYHSPLGDEENPYQSSSILGGTSLSNSTARTEIPKMLAHVKVSSLSSNFLSVDVIPREEHSREHSKTKTSSSVRTEMKQLKEHVKVSERASNYTIIPKSGSGSIESESKSGSRRASTGTFIVLTCFVT